MKPESYLSQIEIEHIKKFNENKPLKEALRKVFLAPLYLQGVMTPSGVLEDSNPTLNFALTPAFNMLLQKREMWDVQKLGIDTLTAAKAIQLVEQGFGELEKFKFEVKVEKESEELDPR